MRMDRRESRTHFRHFFVCSLRPREAVEFNFILLLTGVGRRLSYDHARIDGENGSEKIFPEKPKDSTFVRNATGPLF
jgi:hypothetical protein